VFIQKLLALNKKSPDEIGWKAGDTAACIVLRCDYSALSQPEATVAQLQKSFRESFALAIQQIHYKQSDLTLPFISAEKNTAAFNERAAILEFLFQEQRMLSSSLPFNYAYLEGIAQKYHADKVIFAVHYGNEKKYVDCLTFNLKTGEVLSEAWEKFQYPPSKQQVIKALTHLLTTHTKISLGAASDPSILENLK
jgi:hypothetical protein